MKLKSIRFRIGCSAVPAARWAILAVLGFSSFTLAASAAAQADGGSKEKGETYYLLVFNNATAGQDAEFNQWYDHQHAQDVVAVPGFKTAQRFVLSDTQLREGKPFRKYLIFYKIVTGDLPSVYKEVNRRLQSGETKEIPAFDKASSSGFTYKPIGPVILHQGSRKGIGESESSNSEKTDARLYYQIVFSDPTPGQEDEYNKWYNTQHAPDVVSAPGFVSAQRFALNEVQLNEKPPLGKYLAMFRIESADISATFAEFRKLAPKMPMSPAFGQNVGYTYQAIGPVIYGDKVRAERAKKH